MRFFFCLFALFSLCVCSGCSSSLPEYSASDIASSSESLSLSERLQATVDTKAEQLVVSKQFIALLQNSITHYALTREVDSLLFDALDVSWSGYGDASAMGLEQPCSGAMFKGNFAVVPDSVDYMDASIYLGGLESLLLQSSEVIVPDYSDSNIVVSSDYYVQLNTDTTLCLQTIRGTRQLIRLDLSQADAEDAMGRDTFTTESFNYLVVLRIQGGVLVELQVTDK